MPSQEVAVYLLLPIMIILLIFSCFFSAAETSITSINVIRLKEKVRFNNKKIDYQKEQKILNKAKKVYKLVKDYDRTLTTILIANTLINTALATIGTLFFVTILKNNSVGTIVATIVIGLIVLILGEIIPKIIAKQNPENFAIFASYILIFWKFLFYPFTWLLVLISHKKVVVSATENELLLLISTIESEGVLERNEKKLIESAIIFDEKTLDTVMIPKNKVKSIDENCTWEELKKIYQEQKFTRMPVLSADKTKIIGIINIKDAFIAILQNKQVDIHSLLRSPLFIPKNTKLDDVLEIFQQEQLHIAIVTKTKTNKEYLGIVTLEDILEELVGEIYDEDDLTGQVKEIGHHMFWVHGHILVKKVFNKYLHLATPKNEGLMTLYDWYCHKTGYDYFTANKAVPAPEYIYNNYAFRINIEKTEKLSSKGIMMEIEMLRKNKNKYDF